MELRTGNEQLRRINMQIDSLVEDIRTELLARDDASVELNDTTVRSLLKYIANPLKNISIDGDEKMLDDMLDLYDLVIEQLDQIVQDKTYSDNKALSESEIKTFEKARDILKTDKEQGIDVIDEIYTEIIGDYKSGKLEDTYIGRKVASDKEISEIDKKIYAIGAEISTALRPTLDLLDKLKPELDQFEENEKISKQVDEIDKKLDTISIKLADKDLDEEERKVLELAQKSLLDTKISTIVSDDPKYEKDEYKQKPDEDLSDYATRLNNAFAVRSTEVQRALEKKIVDNQNEKINIVEINQSTGNSEIKEVVLGARYFSNVNSKIGNKQILSNFSRDIKLDLENLQALLDAKIDEKTELESQKAELAEKIKNDIKSSTLSVVPYIERTDGKELSEFAKWRQRMAFRFKNLDFLFQDRKDVEKAMCQAKIDNSVIPIDRAKLLNDIEKESKKGNFKDKYAAKAKARSDIYNAWDKNKIKNSRNNGESR